MKEPAATRQDDEAVSADQAATNDTGAEGDKTLRKRLLSRIAVAGVAILGLLAGLAIFEVLQRPQQSAMPKMAAVSSESTVAQEPAKAEKMPETVAPALAEKPEEKTNAQDARAEKAAESASHHAPPAEPAAMAKPLTAPATPKTASIRPALPEFAPLKPGPRKEVAKSSQKAIPEHTTALTTPLAITASAPSLSVAPKSLPTPASAAVAAKTPEAPPESRALTQAIASAKRFLVQIGVFNNIGNAEELVAKLQAAGIPAQIESRVQAGPFATRAEADAARTKLKAMGYDDGLLVRR